MYRADEAIVTPLRKRRLSGELYERDPKTEALIAELAVLPRDALSALTPQDLSIQLHSVDEPVVDLPRVRRLPIFVAVCEQHTI